MRRDIGEGEGWMLGERKIEKTGKKVGIEGRREKVAWKLECWGDLGMD